MGKSYEELYREYEELYREDCVEVYKQYESADEFLEACLEGTEGGEKIYSWRDILFTADELERIWKDGEAYMLYI